MQLGLKRDKCPLTGTQGPGCVFHRREKSLSTTRSGHAPILVLACYGGRRPRILRRHAQPGVLWGGGRWVAAVGLVAAHSRPTAPFLSYPTFVNTIVGFLNSLVLHVNLKPSRLPVGARTAFSSSTTAGENSVDASPGRLS